MSNQNRSKETQPDVSRLIDVILERVGEQEDRARVEELDLRERVKNRVAEMASTSARRSSIACRMASAGVLAPI